MSDPQYSVAQFESMRLEITCLTRDRDILRQQRDHCRRLLRKICESPVIGMPLEQGQYDYTKKVVVIEDDVLNAAREAAGGGDD